MAAHKDYLCALVERPEVRSWRVLMGAFQSVYQELERGLLAEGCSIPRFQVLFLLYFSGPLSGTEIARSLLVTRGNISMFLKRLQADQIIAPVKSPETKRQRYTLSAKGRRMFEKLFPDHVERVCKRVPVLDPKILRLLHRIAGHSEANPKLVIGASAKESPRMDKVYI